MADNNNNQNQSTPELLPTSAAVGVQRAVRAWLNTCPSLPAAVSAVVFEALPANGAGLCFSTVQAPFYAARYIGGGYRAEYKFRLIYRVLPSDDSDILDAVEALATVAEWCETAAPPDLTDAVSERVSRASDAAILAAYEDGSNDYYNDLILTWEVF